MSIDARSAGALAGTVLEGYLKKLYPTAAPLHAKVTGASFTDLVMRGLYDSGVPYNCFPSLHVAQCYLAASCCHKVHRRTGMAAFVWATLVALSTLYTKQHYVADVVAGTALAFAISHLFLRGYPRETTPAEERRLAPSLAVGAFSLYGLGILGLWAAYMAVQPQSSPTRPGGLGPLGIWETYPLEYTFT